MRLLYLTRTYTCHDARWLRALVGQDLELAFLPLQNVDATAFATEHPAVPLLASPGLPANADTAQLDAIQSLVRAQCDAWRPDVILAGPLTDAGYLAARILPDRTLLMSWAFDVLHEPATRPGAADRLKDALQRGRHLFTDCPALVRHCEAIAGRKSQQGCVLPWGLAAEDKPQPRTGWRQRLGDQDAKVILHVRGFSAVQQPETVLEGFRLAHAQDARLRLWMAGDGSERKRIEGLAESSGLRSVVRFLGHLDQSDLAGAFAGADAYLAHSLSDGTSLSLLQAMHAGLPCVVSDLSGNREWLDARGGWFVPTGQPAAMARALSDCLAISAEDRAEIAVAHRLRVATRADLTSNLPRLLRTLHAIAHGFRSVTTAPFSYAL